LPMGEYKNFDDCVQKNRDKTDPKAFCGWLKNKIEGADELVLFYLHNSSILSKLYEFEPTKQLSSDGVMRLLTKQYAQSVLNNPSVLKKDQDATIIDDHRWIHMWANTIRDGNELFLTKEQLRKLHDLYVDEFMRRRLNHQSALKFEVYQLMGSQLKEVIKKRQPFLVDPEFLSFVGSSLSDKENPRDLDVLIKSLKHPEYREAYLSSVPDELRDGLSVLFEPRGPSGPYIQGYELWALPTEDVSIKEPKFHIQPMSPIPPPKAKTLNEEELRGLDEDSYYAIMPRGIRLMIHKNHGEVIAYDEKLEEIELPDAVHEAILGIDDPQTFILDGFLANQSQYHMIDMPWWRDSEHINHAAEIRHHFMNKLSRNAVIDFAPSKYFSCKSDIINYLQHEKGPYLLIPGSSNYPINGDAKWMLYTSDGYDLAEASDAKIKELINSGKWESMSADSRFSLMTKRREIEPLYPFAQLKTTKKGYSAREVFGLKSVKDLAEEIFKVPSRQSVEAKIDGFRVQVHKSGDRVKLFTESGHDITKQLPTIVKDIQSLPAESFVLDAEATPYDKDFSNLGRGGAAPAFAMGAKNPVDDSMWALHVFDILYLDGEQLHHLLYSTRRQFLRGIELPVKEYPKAKSDFKLHLWENTVHTVTSASAMEKMAEEVSKIPASEGAMFKDEDSRYQLNGNTPLWSKMKATFEIDAIVVGVNQEGNTFNYVGAIGPVDATSDSEAPVDDPKGRKFTKYRGKVYSILGKTFNTKIEAKVGDIIRVNVKDASKINDQVYHWFHPQVLEKREDKTRPDPLKTIETISETAAKQQKLAYLVSARYGFESPLACCLSPWIAVPGDNWTYLKHDDAAYTELKKLGVTALVGTNTEREILDAWTQNGLAFTMGKALTISEYLSPALYLSEVELPDDLAVDINELKAFYADNRSSPIDHMTVSCCDALVPLTKPLHLEDVYLHYPLESKTWKYVIQFHLRGLSIHADFRAQIDDKRLIGWTWSVGKSLLRPMMRRLNDKVLQQVGVTRKQIDEMTVSELSQKVRSTKEGKALIKQLSAKTQDLSQGQLKALSNEVWDDEFQPVLDNPNNKIVTQRKSPEPMEWLDYEGEVPAGAVGATRELEGQFIIMDKGDIQFGAQKSYFHEYWINGARIKNRRIIVRRLATKPKWEMEEAFAWMAFFTKPDEAPYTISSRAVTKKWMPPDGISALPKQIRNEIPSEYQYWKKETPAAIRDELVKGIKKKDVTVKLSGLKFAVKRVWHKGPEVRRGIPVVRNWLLLHDGKKVLDAWDFGRDSDPTTDMGVTARRKKDEELSELLPESGEISADHPASYTKALPNHFDTSDEGSAQITSDTDDMLQIKLNGKTLHGAYVFVREDSGSEMWTFAKADLSESKMAMMLTSMECTTGYCKTTGVMHLSPDEFKQDRSGNLLFISGPGIKPGEVIPMDGKPAFFTKEGIEKFWPSMIRQPIVVLHGDLKGDVIGFVDKIHYDSETGWGWIDRGVVWHPMGIKMILDGTLPAFSIEVLPEVIWDPEHQHEHVIGGNCVGIAVVPVGACKTCNIVSAEFSQMKVEAGKVYKFGMTAGEYIRDQYWSRSKSTQEISTLMGIPRSTIENWMNSLGIPRRSYTEARHLRSFKEKMSLGGRLFLTALGSGNSSKTGSGKDNRNIACTLLSSGPNHLLINAPRGVNAMLGLVQVAPKDILLESDDASAIGGLHELRALKPNVFATKEVWETLRANYRSISGQKGSFEDLYDFPRYVIKDKGFTLGDSNFTAVPIPTSGQVKSTGFKINAGGVNLWHASSISESPGEALEGVHVYIGDGSSEKGHASIEEQIDWASKAGIRQIMFTKIGDYSHEELSGMLRDLAPNAQALFDGARVGLTPGSTAALLPDKLVQALAKGEKVILVRTKPYTELSKQTILFGNENNLAGLYIEGFPEGPHSAEKVKQMKSQHLLSDKEWKQLVGDAENVWIYHPRTLEVFDEAREYMVNNSSKVGPYIYDVALIH